MNKQTINHHSQSAFCPMFLFLLCLPSYLSFLQDLASGFCFSRWVMCEFRSKLGSFCKFGVGFGSCYSSLSFSGFTNSGLSEPKMTAPECLTRQVRSLLMPLMPLSEWSWASLPGVKKILGKGEAREGVCPSWPRPCSLKAKVIPQRHNPKLRCIRPKKYNIYSILIPADWVSPHKPFTL